MKKVILIISAAILSVFGAKAQEADYSRYVETIQKMTDDANQARYDFAYDKAEHLIAQAIMVFNTQSRDFQEANQALKGELCYDLARYRSLQGKSEEALEALTDAVDLGWNNHAFAKNDGDLDNIRRSKKFKSLMAAMKQKA